MIGNYMWDSNTNTSFDIGVNKDSLMPLWWNGSEPLWVTLTKAKRKVHMYYWPGEYIHPQLKTLWDLQRQRMQVTCVETKPGFGE